MRLIDDICFMCSDPSEIEVCVLLNKLEPVWVALCGDCLGGVQSELPALEVRPYNELPQGRLI